MFTTILIFLLILLALVLVHEWGHFFAARKLGVKVKEFAFGFPPRLFSLKKKDTTYSFNALPIGGYVKLKGEDGSERSEPDSFSAQPAWRRTLILVGGVAMNVVLAFILLTAGFATGIPTVVDDKAAAQARNIQIQILEVTPDSPAEFAGLKLGDVIIGLDGKSFQRVEEIQAYLAPRQGREVQVELKRGETKLTLPVVPAPTATTGERAVMGVSLVQTGIVSYPWYESIWRGLVATGILTKEIVLAFGNLFKNLIVAREVPGDVAGPVGIAVLTGQVVDLGFAYLLQFAALLSLNLAIINILPFPALDGGRLLFVVIEKIRGKRNDERVEAMVHNIGFALLMLLVLVITYRDIVRLSSGFFSSLGNLWG